MTGSNGPGNSDKPGPQERYYDLLLKRLMHEYDQRDRDFLMYVTINIPLFGGAGFLINQTAVNTNVLFDSLLAGIGLIGLLASVALIGSVMSFNYWQTLMHANLARLEIAFLPDIRLAYWCQVAKCNPETWAHLHHVSDRDERKKIKDLHITVPPEKDLTRFRLYLAIGLTGVWGCLLVYAIIITISLITCLHCCPADAAQCLGVNLD